MTTLIENDSREVIKILTSTGRTILDVYTDTDLLEVMLAIISKEIENKWIDKADPTTDKGRKVLISRARSIASVSLRLDELGKEEVSKLKDLPKQVDAGRRHAKEYFDKWKEETRRPVTEYEDKQRELKESAQIIVDHEQAILDNVHFEVEKERKLKQVEREREELKRQLKEEVTIELKEGTQKVVASTVNATGGHKTFVHRQILTFFMDVVNISEDDCKALITAIVKGKNPYIKINY